MNLLISHITNTCVSYYRYTQLQCIITAIPAVYVVGACVNFITYFQR